MTFVTMISTSNWNYHILQPLMVKTTIFENYQQLKPLLNEIIVQTYDKNYSVLNNV